MREHFNKQNAPQIITYLRKVFNGEKWRHHYNQVLVFQNINYILLHSTSKTVFPLHTLWLLPSGSSITVVVLNGIEVFKINCPFLSVQLISNFPYSLSYPTLAKDTCPSGCGLIIILYTLLPGNLILLYYDTSSRLHSP